MSGELNRKPVQCFGLLTFQRSLHDWRRGSRICGFNNGNPKGTSVTSLHFVDEEVGGALVVGSSDGVVRIYNNYDPCYSEGNPVQLVSGFRALATMVPASHGAGIVTEWNQMWNRLLCGGDSESVYDWDAMTERCVTVSILCLRSCRTRVNLS
jgi:regulator-associated protein of mTOR